MSQTSDSAGRNWRGKFQFREERASSRVGLFLGVSGFLAFRNRSLFRLKREASPSLPATEKEENVVDEGDECQMIEDEEHLTKDSIMTKVRGQVWSPTTRVHTMRLSRTVLSDAMLMLTVLLKMHTWNITRSLFVKDATQNNCSTCPYTP